MADEIMKPCVPIQCVPITDLDGPEITVVGRIVTPEEYWANYEAAHVQPRPWGDDCDDISVWCFTATDTGVEEDRWSWACGCGAPHPQPRGFRGYDTALEAIVALANHAATGDPHLLGVPGSDKENDG